MKKSKKITALMAALSVFGLTGCDLGSISDSIKNFDVWNLVDPLHWFHDKEDKDQDQDKDDDKDVAVTSVVVTPSTLSLKEGESRLLSVEVLPSNATNKTVTWTSTNPEVATVSNGNVVAVKEGSATIKATADGKEGQCVVTVTKDGEDTPPVPVEITEIVSVNGPAQLEQDSVVNKADFTLTVKYSDGTTHTANPDRIELSTAVVGDAIQGTAYINQLSKTFTIKIVAKEVPPVTDTITPQKAIELMDAAGEGVVVTGLQKVKGICAANTKYDTQYKQYTTGFEGVDNFKVQFTDTNNILNGASPDGMEIVVEGYLEKYQGKYQLSYLPASSSPTGEKFTPNLVSATAAVHEGVLDSITVSAAHREFYKGSTFVEETVTAHYSDGASATVKATFSGYDMNTLGEQTVTVSYTEKGVTKQTTYTINVIERGSGHAGTLEDPLTTAEAVTIANGLAETTDSKDPIASEGMYVKGVVTEFKETFSANYGNYSMVIGGDFTLWRIKNGPDFAKFNEGDIEVGDEVIAFVYIMNYKGTPESTSSSYVYSVQKAGDTKTLQSIEIVGSLTKTSYVEGQAYSSAGLSVKGHYDDGSEGTVAATITLNKTTAALGDTEIIASATFKEITAEPKTFTVTVTEKVPVVGGSVYTFKNDKTSSQNMKDWTSEQFMTHVEVDGGEIITGMKDVTNAYIGGNGGSGDTAWNIWDCLKVGKSNAKGEITLLLDGTASFSKIKVSAVGARDDGTLTINEITQNVTKKATKDDLEPIELEYEIAGGITELKLSSKDAASGNYGIVITRIEFVGGDTPTPIKELSSISIEGALTKTTYTEGEAYSAEGLSVVGHYSDGSSADVSATITLDKPIAAVGDTQIVASAEFNGKTATKDLAVTVNAKKIVTGITFSEEHRTFDQYAEFVKETVTATFTVGDPEIVEATFSTPDMTTAGEKTITVSYTDAYGTTVNNSYTITVVGAPEPELTSITIEGALEKTEYNVGETYSAAGLSVVAHYDNGANNTVEVTINLDKTTAAEGDTTITASATFNEKNASKDFTITVINNATIEEVITKDSLGLAASYDSFLSVSETTGVLIGGNAMASNGGYIQFRDLGQGSGIYTRTSGRYIRSIEFEFDDANGKTISVYGQAAGYKAVPEAATGELLGSVTADGKITVTGDYLNILIASTGATYVKSIKLEWSATSLATSVESVTLNKSEADVGLDSTLQLSAIVDGIGVSQNVIWETSDSAKATVANGLVTPVAGGDVVITAKSADDNSVKATCAVTVTSEQTIMATNFATTESRPSHSNYADSWAFGDFTITNGANNNAGWDYIKLGKKSTTQTCTVDAPAASAEVKKVVVAIHSGSLSKTQMSVPEWGVEVFSDKAMTQSIDKVVSTVAITKEAAEVTFTPSEGKTWGKDCYIRVYFNTVETGGGNGVVCLTGITYIG